MRLGCLDGFEQSLHPLLDRRDDLLAARTVVAERILRQRRAQARQHAVVIDDQAEILAGINPVRPRDGLHQRVCLHRLVDVERGQALHVEAGQPHGADDRHAERMLRVLERRLDIDALAIARLEALLHQGAMRDDVKAPFLEVGDLVLCLADDDLDDRLVEPAALVLRASRRRSTSAARSRLHRASLRPPLAWPRRRPEPLRASPSSAEGCVGTCGRR